MPEIPDLTVYVDAMERRIAGRRLEALRIGNPFVLRSVSPGPETLAGLEARSIERLGKQLVINLEPDYFAVIHLMIAGRLHWKKAGAALPKRRGLVAMDFESGSLILTEAGTKRRASLHLGRGREALRQFDRGGLDPLGVSEADFRNRLSRENHTVKRALTDQRFLGGIGNAYSDEILFAARMSPFKKTRDLDADEWSCLYAATRQTLAGWIERLRNQTGDAFPEKVTAFRPEMAVHGRFGDPCPVCGAKVQRIVYATNEANYCAPCQTGGKLLADRALSRLLKESWPRTVDSEHDVE